MTVALAVALSSKNLDGSEIEVAAVVVVVVAVHGVVLVSGTLNSVSSFLIL